MRIGGSKWIKLKKELIKERGNKCEKCGKETNKLIGDHIIPIKFFGEEFNKKNIQLLCEECNKKKTSNDLSLISWFNLLPDFKL